MTEAKELAFSDARIHPEQNCRWQRPSALLLKSAKSAVSNSEFRFSARASGAPFQQKARDLVRSRTDRFSELRFQQGSHRKISILPRRDRPMLGANPLC